MTVTESLLPEIINDFFNKIQQQPLAVRKTNRPFRRLTTVKSVTDTCRSGRDTVHHLLA